VSFATITLCVASQRVFIVVREYLFMTQSGDFWIHPRTRMFTLRTFRIYVTRDQNKMVKVKVKVKLSLCSF
jgi:hypothetical protein